MALPIVAACRKDRALGITAGQLKSMSEVVAHMGEMKWPGRDGVEQGGATSSLIRNHHDVTNWVHFLSWRHAAISEPLYV